MTIPRTGFGTSGLGAVGGARGTAAGSLRLIVEFLTQYDAAAVQQLEADLQGLSAETTNFDAKVAASQKRRETITRKLAEAERELTASIAARTDRSASRAARLELRDIEKQLVGSRAQRAAARQQIADAVTTGVLLQREADLLLRINRARQDIVRTTTRQVNEEAAATIVAEQRLAVEKQLTAFQKLRSELPKRLGGLALGAFGGIVGGALFGVGFAAIQGVLDKIGESLQDIFDPARHARESIKEVGAAINSLAESEGITTLEAAKRLLADLGIAGDEAAPGLLAAAAANQQVTSIIEKRKQAEDIIRHTDELQLELTKSIREELVKRAREEGTLTTQYGARGTAARIYINGVLLETAVQQEHTRLLELDNAAKERDIRLKREQAAAATLVRYAEEAVNNIIAARSDSLTEALNQQIETIQGSSGPSAATKALEEKLRQLRGGDNGLTNERIQIQQERELILLRQRLRLLGTNIDLEKYSGRFLLEAINAKIKALDKQAEAQKRLSRLLDLQFRMSKVIRREEGESIKDFLERRAQENRHLLEEQREITQDAKKSELEDLKEATEDAVKLVELSEKEKALAAKAASDAAIAAIEAQLEASKQADSKALQSKIDGLKKQIDWYEWQAGMAKYWATQAANDEIAQAARSVNTVSEMIAVAGQERGLIAAREFFKALLSSGVLSSSEAAQIQEILNRINKTLGITGDAIDRIRETSYVPPVGPPTPSAKGRVIPLTNASSPLGQNFRFGEEGSELGIILSNRVVQALREQKGGGGVGQIVINESSDPYRDQFLLKQTIKSVLREELN